MTDDNSNEKIKKVGESTGLGVDVDNIKPELSADVFKRKTKLEEIKCPLSDNEKLARGEDLARLHRKIELLEEEKKESAQHYGSLIKEARTEVAKASEALRNGYEYRSTAVETVSDYKTGTVTRSIKETGEIIEHRKMTSTEARIEIEITTKGAEETPAEETPAEETPAEETPAEETPAEETPAEAEETPKKAKTTRKKK